MTDKEMKCDRCDKPVTVITIEGYQLCDECADAFYWALEN